MLVALATGMAPVTNALAFVLLGARVVQSSNRVHRSETQTRAHTARQARHVNVRIVD